MNIDESGPTIGSLAAALLDQSDNLHAISGADGRLHWSNKAFRQAFGVSTASGCLLPDFFGTVTRPGEAALREVLANALLDGRPVDTVVAWRAAVADAPDTGTSSRLRLQIASVADHRLWTLTDLNAGEALKARLQRLEELLDIAQEFGRVGVWERDLSSGTGRWDDHVFRFWGLDPADGTPSFDDASRRIHPDDRSSRQFTDSTRQTGRYSQRFRVIQADGSLRWLHSHWEIKSSADGVPSHAVGVMVDDSETMSMARQLSEATAKLTIAVELGEIVVFEQNLRSDQVAVDARGCEILGLPFNEHGTSVDDFERLIHPDDRDDMRAAGMRALNERRPVDMQMRYRRSDGQWRHLLSRRVLQRDATDQPLALVGVALDVTDRVHAQRALEETARGLEVATLAAAVGIWSRDLGSGEGHWNAQMFRFFDRDPQLGVPSRDEWLFTMIHPDDRTLMGSVQQRLQVSSQGATSEYRVRRADGSARWLVELAHREERDGRSMLFGATLDITDRKNSELALRQANERIALATRGAGIGTWERDTQTGAVCWDEQMFLLRGLHLPADAGQRGRAASELRHTLVHPDDLPQIADDNRHTRSDASMASHEYRVRWPDGSFRWLASRSIAVHDDSGEAVRQIGVEWDVHERVMADEVRREAQVAQRQSEAKAALLARMSHELRTPLNAILGFTDLMARDPSMSTEPGASATGSGLDRREHLAHIRHAAERLSVLIDDVLDLSKIETGEMNLHPAAIDMLALLQEIVALNSQKARMRSVDLHLRGDPVTAFADPSRLRLILSQLVAHHVGAAPARSRLELSVARAGNEVRVAIAEREGPNAAAHQFDLFMPAGMAPDGPRSDQAADLGLFSAVLNGMHGRIERDPDGAGTERVAIWLPMAPAELEANAPALVTPAAQGRLARVLYIEDNPVNVILVEELVRQRGGIDFCSEADGHSGVERATQWQPDLILIDIQLPDIDGFEVLRRLRVEPLTASTCCVALSANAMTEDVARARAAGFDDYWTKPIRFASFLAGLNRLLPTGSQVHAAAP